jgi:hypothetical protein
VNDLREEHDENEYNLMCVNSDSVSNEIDDITLGFEKQYDQEFEHNEELQRQCRVIVTKKVNAAPSFFCSGLQPQIFFPWPSVNLCYESTRESGQSRFARLQKSRSSPIRRRL